MDNQKLPFNIDLLDNSKGRFGRLRPVTTNDIYEGHTKNFHPDGLYSTEIFGKVGEEDRDRRFSYIDVKTQIMHPTIFNELIKIKGLYKEIISGRARARWNPQTKDFERSAEVGVGIDVSSSNEGTGYAFFMKHFPEMKFKKNASNIRGLRIDLLEKYRTRCMYQYIPVIPAGMRDIEINEDDGRTREDEINDLYRRLVAVSRSIVVIGAKVNDPVHDKARWSLQIALNEIYATLKRMLEGKKGFIQSKWGRRSVFNGTRNVISSMDFSVPNALGAQSIAITDTQVGLYQTMKGALPLAVHCLKTGIIGKVFGANDVTTPLINKKNLNQEFVSLSPSVRDRWTTVSGLEGLIDKYKYSELRHKPVEIQGHYLALIYDDGKVFKVFNDMADLPPEFSREHVRPITWCELFYTSSYAKLNSIYCTITRYPITGLGSTYPSSVYLKTTVNGNVRKPLGDDWKIDPGAPVANEMPDTLGKGEHFDSTSIHVGNIAGLGADYDGDMVSVIYIYSLEGMAEARDFLNSPRAFIDPRGGLMHSYSDNVEWALINMTR